MTTGILVTPTDLDALLRGDHPPRVLDVRWRLDAPDGRPAYLAGHIPSAVYVSLDDDLAAQGAPTDGRHPLPSAEEFERAVRGWGVNAGDEVVVYDDWSSLAAARAWWMLADAGVPVRVLDGGLRAWRDAGLPLAEGEVSPEVGDVTLSPGHLPQLSIEEAAGFAEHGILLDVRAGERYRGETEPIDPRAGHIPGARNVPTAANLDADGRFLHDYALRELYTDLGIRSEAPVGVYCGSGVTASHAALALTIAGYAPAVYIGSWSQWSNHPDRPVATGDMP